MNSLTLNAHLQRLHKNQSPSKSVGSTFISFSIWTLLFICMGFQLSRSAPYWVTTLKDLLNKKQNKKKQKKNKQAHVMPGSITNTSCDIDLRLKCCFVGGWGCRDTNSELFLEHKCICFYFFLHYLRLHIREAAATLVHICLHLVFIECTVTVHTCISNLAVIWKFRHKTSCSFSLECVIGAGAPSVCSAALMRTFSIVGVICDGHDKAK